MADMKCKYVAPISWYIASLSKYWSSGLHGYSHEYMSLLSPQQERDVLRKSIEVLTAFTGKKPKGFTAPAWTPSRETVRLSVSQA